MMVSILQSALKPTVPRSDLNEPIKKLKYLKNPKPLGNELPMSLPHSAVPGTSLSYLIHNSFVCSHQHRIKGQCLGSLPVHSAHLFLSMIAAIQAPVIMMSQNRQDKKDRLRNQLDFDVNRSAHSEIQGLARRINLLYDKIEDMEEILREKK